MERANHPKGLYLLFIVEMWERFSYYGMRALLILYMTKALFFSTEKSGALYGSYTSLVYLSPLIGGYIADRYWGIRKSIVAGSILLIIGHFTLAFNYIPVFYIALLFIILGTGFFKSNISTLVGTLYEENDPRRDGGFTIFYMGINVGAFFSPLVCGYLGERIGWHYGFAAAGVGMGLGLIVYLWGQKRYLGDKGLLPSYKETLKNSSEKHPKLTKVEKQRIWVLFILTFFSVFFWTAFEQAGSSLTLFADRQTDRFIPLLNWEMPASFFQSLNPLFIVIFAPFFSKIWIGLSDRNKEPSTPIKFVYGLLIVAFSFVLMIAAVSVYKQYGPVSIFWLVAVYLLDTLGELCLSPVGLSMVTKLAPAKFASLLMGVYLLSSFFANLLAGLFAGNYDSMDHSRFFAVPMVTALASGLLLLVITPKLKKWMNGIH